MDRTLVYLGLGSNLGDRLENLRAAIESLVPEVRVVEKSPVYQTPPWGYEAQPSFLNQVVAGETCLNPDELLKQLKNIEAALGRQPTFRNGPRVIDLDILFYDSQVIRQPELMIPHARLHERAFVLVPLAVIAPEFLHPVLGLTVREMLQAVDPTGVEAYTE